MEESGRDKGRWRKERERERERVMLWWILAHGPAHGTSSVFVCVVFVSVGSMPLPGSHGCCWNRITHAAWGAEWGEEAGAGAAEGEPRGKTWLRQTLHLFQSIYIISSLVEPIPAPHHPLFFFSSNQTSRNILVRKTNSPTITYCFTQMQMINSLMAQKP